MRSLLALPLLALSFAACGDDGPRTAQSRDVAPFTKLVNDTSVDVRLHVGGEPQPLRVRAGENVIDDVRTEVRDGTLHIAFDHDGWGGDDVQVEAWTPTLDAITVDGSGNVEARGSTPRLQVVSDGSGDAKLADLEADAAKVNADGSGNVEVRAADTLDVSLDGSGDVRYHGEPRLTQHDDGSGEVERAH
ncbi:DUF2807 domain-containing protein [Solirubrobacter sp. CPCC 204708]|uniref:DUF2807 domain-containing protein n=1 Tax=Solirubrobacter deserti TaxID=2282478 RepID=A0ABT4RRF8_9ACTN|nr:DUF2807 domain-containing protein [Solirubrobacter deserti]MBE2319343.1 DUF2807 domain-containing protein [Solirubrobacter deserti]MDA0140841.1 DUF2807 domain-containing protein [Solirubrobacter deserti]